MGSPDAALRLTGVSASYGPRSVLSDVDLHAAPGEIVALFGHNGAGKTTALRVAAGLKAPTAGRVELLGRDVRRTSAATRARSGLALVPEGVRGIFPTLTVRQNLELAAVPRDDGLEEALRSAFGEVLVDRMDQLAGSMSGGQRQMLAISLALTRRPAVLLLDEPSTGLAPAIVARIFSTVAELAPRAGTAVVVVEQDVPAALEVSHRIVVLQSGSIVAEFSRADCPPATELWRFF